MAKILVADDNSNVQKTVALALGGLGVDVVSVNNGEAAVRKLADFSPDLILADIFMPVRNGYEVCEYVKKESRFAHVPVVLLVGAFDPLDEREAQRVGADGILKKPFVPPDPLITMVKTLLEKTLGERLVAVSVSKPTAVAAERSGRAAVAEEHSPDPEIADDTQTPQFPHPAAHVTSANGEYPVAFGQLLEPSAQDSSAPAAAVLEPVDNDLVLTSSRDANLGDPIFWRNDSPEPEPQALEEPQDLAAAVDLRTWKPGEDSLPRREETALLQTIEPIEIVREEQDTTEQTVVDSKAVLLDQAAQAPLHVESGVAPDLAANPLEWMATAPQEHVEQALESAPGWDEPIPDATEAIVPVEMTDPVHDHAPAELPPSVPVMEINSAPTTEKEKEIVPVAPAVLAPPVEKSADKTSPANKTQPSLVPFTQKPEDTVHSVPKHDWVDLSAALQAGTVEPPLRLAKPSIVLTPSIPESAHADRSADSNKVSAPVESAASIAKTPPPSDNLPKPAASATPLAVAIPPVANLAPGATSAPDAALVEAVVQRVLDKMRPQVVDIITREFLRPIVQALVHREVEKH